MSTNFEQMTKGFIVREGVSAPPDAHAYLQSISEVLDSIAPRTRTESRRLSVARENLNHLRRQVKRMSEQIKVFEEQKKLQETQEE